MSFATFFSKALFVFGVAVFCVILGAPLGAKLLTGPGSMGWDALANMLAGAFLGLLFGGLAGIIIAVKLKTKHITRGNLFVFAGIALEILAIFLAKQTGF
ncbi:MAG: hypothetical protein ACE5IR_14290 [bacterium]